jgi:hypothetical protein
MLVHELLLDDGLLLLLDRVLQQVERVEKVLDRAPNLLLGSVLTLVAAPQPLLRGGLIAPHGWRLAFRRALSLLAQL